MTKVRTVSNEPSGGKALTVAMYGHLDAVHLRLGTVLGLWDGVNLAGEATSDSHPGINHMPPYPAHPGHGHAEVRLACHLDDLSGLPMNARLLVVVGIAHPWNHAYPVDTPEPECPACKTGGEPGRIASRPHVLRCRSCRKETRLMAGTIMQDSHTPMSVWFWGAYLISSLTPGMSAVQFQRQLGLTRYETAFQILHKLRSGMVRPERDRIGGKFPCEVDETYIGGKTRGQGKGVHHGVLVAGAVEVRTRKPTDPKNMQHSKAVPRRGGKYAGRLRLAVVPDRSAKSLVRFVEDNVEGGTIITDAWQGYASLRTRDFDHRPVAERNDPAVAEEYLPLIHLVFSNLKTWINGVHHGVDPQHLQAYLNEFTFRFNRRFYPFNAFRSLLGIAADSEAHTYAGLYAGRPAHPGEIRESA